ncbi:hypothetical protein AsAng_0055190 [Aureispira anguillae]|uniref:Uncharacterized protein n=1 Tax=Aureispira anguillae TaxID=2864201 RepID=A0A915YKQ4_9BACT|nr:hypothetical protein AsAng_0055190 [Aureispira anguillae]
MKLKGNPLNSLIYKEYIKKTKEKKYNITALKNNVFMHS